MPERFHSGFGLRSHRKQSVRTVMVLAAAVLCVAGLAAFFTLWGGRLGGERKELHRLWENGEYGETFRISGEALARKPLDYFLLSLHGYSAYQLAMAQINSFDTLSFIDEAVWSLRKALLTRRGAGDPAVFYVLGKAYYYKGPGYGDLAVKYLEAARDARYRARDIPEYLGQAYAAVRDYRNSVDAFAQALEPEGSEPSDRLLYYIARSYMQLEEFDTARAYLVRCLELSRDAATQLAAKMLLGNVLAAAGDSAGAEAAYLAVLEADGENAGAYFQLGELYAAGGDTIKSRARWRRALQIDPTHSGARARLNM